ncbi:MAG: hypothetical protein ABS76_16260 [Pelagibacterium sp. SCN 64-44]|nr:MAG: hypothetical protein ABS76_16260 [Pelagibacterium sp. SCN 64-44]
MTTYKITHLSGRSVLVEDPRSLEALTVKLCQEGFLTLRVRSSGYSNSTKRISILERAVATIEPQD